MRAFWIGVFYGAGGWFIGGLFGAFIGDEWISFFWTIGAIVGFLYGVVKASQDSTPSEAPTDLSSSEKAGRAAMPNSSPQQRPGGSYREVIPELVAACISADGKITDGKIDVATELLAGDPWIHDKVSALEALQRHLQALSEARETSRAMYKLKVSTIIQKVLTIRDKRERHGCAVFLYGMLGAAGSKPGDEIKNIVNEIDRGWFQPAPSFSRIDAAEEFVLKSGDGEAIAALKRMQADPRQYEQRFKQAAKGNSVMRIALGVFTGMIAAELVTSAIYQHQLQEALAQFDMDLASMGGLENLDVDIAPFDTSTFQTASWQEPGDDVLSDVATDESTIGESDVEGLGDADIDTDFDFFV